MTTLSSPENLLMGGSDISEQFQGLGEALAAGGGGVGTAPAAPNAEGSVSSDHAPTEAGDNSHDTS